MTKYFTQDLFVLYKIMFKKLIKKSTLESLALRDFSIDLA